jgi:membrane associated rhomboid family serine protease
MYQTITPIVRNLLIVNLGLFALQMMANLNLPGLLGLHNINSEFFSPYQLFTYMFVHASFGHILSNMFGLFMFGTLLEKAFGARRFLFFYIAAGIGAGVLNGAINYVELSLQEESFKQFKQNPTPEALVQYLHKYEPANYEKNVPFTERYAEYPDDKALRKEAIDFLGENLEGRKNVPTVGASGAIFALLVAFAMLFPNLELFLLFFPFPLKAKYFVLIYVCFELYSGIYRAESSNVAHFAHLSGALIGFLLVKYWKIPRHY